MKISEITVQQVGYGREYERGGVKVRDLIARCLDSGTNGNLGSAAFFDVRLRDIELKKANELIGKRIEVLEAVLRQPFAGAPFSIEGTIKLV
jgi:hypothetical protein